MKTVKDTQRTALMTVPVPLLMVALVMMSYVLHAILTVMPVQLTMRQITADETHVLEARSRVIQLSFLLIAKVIETTQTGTNISPNATIHDVDSMRRPFFGFGNNG